MHDQKREDLADVAQQRLALGEPRAADEDHEICRESMLAGCKSTGLVVQNDIIQNWNDEGQHVVVG